MSTPRTPLRVRCGHCSHVWIALYLPLPIAEAAAALRALHCPACATGAKHIHLEETSRAESGLLPPM